MRQPKVARLYIIVLPPSKLRKGVPGEHEAGKSKAADTGGGGAGLWKSVSEYTTTTYGVGAPRSCRARRGRAAMAMPPSIYRRPGFRSLNRMPLSLCDRQT